MFDRHCTLRLGNLYGAGILFLCNYVFSFIDYKYNFFFHMVLTVNNSLNIFFLLLMIRFVTNLLF